MGFIRNRLLQSVMGIALVFMFVFSASAATGASSVAAASNAGYTSNALGSNNGTYAILNSGSASLGLKYSAVFGGGIRAYVKNPDSTQSVNVSFGFVNVQGSNVYGAGSVTLNFAPGYSGSVLLTPSGQFNQVNIVKNSGPAFWVDAVLAS